MRFANINIDGIVTTETFVCIDSAHHFIPRMHENNGRQSPGRDPLPVREEFATCRAELW